MTPAAEARAVGFLRASGVPLAALVLGHLLSLWWFAERHGPGFASAAMRLGNPFWRLWDWSAITLALVHGGVGLALLVDRRVASSGWRSAASALLWGAVLAAAAFATYAYLTLPFFPRNPLHGGP